MKGKFLFAAVAIIAVIVIATFAGLYFSNYNNIVTLDQAADAQWAQIDQELQRRYELIPNVVTAASAYMKYEGSVLENITRLRSQFDAAVDSGNLDDINNATAQMESGVSNLIISFEAYPDLKASGIVQSLMSVLEGTENRISTERMRYNEDVRDYNTAIAVFPANLWSAGWGFTAKSYFQAQVGSTEAPPVTL
jgi:LemA protein